LAEWEQLGKEESKMKNQKQKERKNERKRLTLTGLMEGVKQAECIQDWELG
jgi:hypothetical protein